MIKKSKEEVSNTENPKLILIEEKLREVERRIEVHNSQVKKETQLNQLKRDEENRRRMAEEKKKREQQEKLEKLREENPEFALLEKLVQQNEQNAEQNKKLLQLQEAMFIQQDNQIRFSINH